MTGFTKTPQSELAIELVKQKSLRTLGMLPVSIFKAPDVMTYYRAKVKSLHPDSIKGEGTDPVVQNFHELRMAKDFLIGWLEDK